MIDIYHNILWSRYKGVVFTHLNQLASQRQLHINFFQIAETEDIRAGLGAVDTSVHNYPYTLLFNGSYERVGRIHLLRRLMKLILRSKAQLIILPGYSNLEHWWMFFLAKLTGKKLGVFCDSTSQDSRPNKIKAKLKQVFFSRCDIIFAYGQRSSQYVIAHGAKPQVVVHPCQAAETFALAPASESGTQCPSTPDWEWQSAGGIRFLYVGRLSEEKGLSLLLDAWQRHSAAFPADRLCIVGDGPQRQHLYSQVANLNCTATVGFVGAKKSQALPQYYQHAHVFVLPSSVEPWGLVVNEAFSYDCPAVVSSACGCVPELITATTGKEFTSGNRDSLVEQLAAARRQFGDKRGQGECRRLISRYTPDKAAETMLDGIGAVIV